MNTINSGSRIILIFTALTSIPLAVACTCVSALDTTPLTEMKDATVVFRGTVFESKRLPEHPDSSLVRSRYAVTFRVNRLWKGNQGKTVTLYDITPGTDCQGFGFEVGKEYLVYAFKGEAEDFKLDDHLIYAWTDILPRGTPMLRLMSCTPSGETSTKGVRNILKQLGAGNPPSRQ